MSMRPWARSARGSSSPKARCGTRSITTSCSRTCRATCAGAGISARSEEHTSELQSRQYLVCRLLLEKNEPSPWLGLPLCQPPVAYALLAGLTVTQLNASHSHVSDDVVVFELIDVTLYVAELLLESGI